MRNWRVRGYVYKFNKSEKNNDKIIINILGDDAKRLSELCKFEKTRYYFSISIKNVKIKNELILKHTNSLEDLTGIEIDISGYSKNYRFKNAEGDFIEGISLHANTIN
jgi:DNA-binding protein